MIIPQICVNEKARISLKFTKSVLYCHLFEWMCIEFSKKLGILIHTWLPIVVANAPLFKTGNRNHCSAAIFSKKEWWVSVWPPVREPWDEEEEMEAGKVAGNLKLWWWTCILNDSDDDANFFYFFIFFSQFSVHLQLYFITYLPRRLNFWRTYYSM